MSELTPPQARIALVEIGEDGKGYVTQEWYPYLAQDLLDRVGGAVAATNSDLQTAQFEDAGIPEQQAEIYAVDQAFGQQPPAVVLPTIDDVSSIAQLQARVDALERAIQDIRQGLQA